MSILYEATGGGGHEMIPVGTNDADLVALAALPDGDEDKVINAYTAKRWGNVDVVSLTVEANQGEDTIGTWEDSYTWKTSGVRTGWLWATDLYNVLSNDDIEITPIFDIDKSEVVSLYAMRIDDDVTHSLYLEVTPAGTENPSTEGWYEKTGSTYTLTADTTVISGKTYYEYKTLHGGAVAFKLNSPIYSSGGVRIGVNIKHQRIATKELIRL